LAELPWDSASREGVGFGDDPELPEVHPDSEMVSARVQPPRISQGLLLR
jgi:hypothetical protein